MAEEIKIGSALFEIKTTLDEMKSGLQKAKSEAKKEAGQIQKNLSNIKMQMDDRLMKLKLRDVEKLHLKLKSRLEEKIKLNYDIKSIETTRKQLESVKNALRDVKRESRDLSASKFTGANLFSSAKGIAGGVGLAIGASEVARITAEAVQLAAKVEGVKNAFDKLDDPNLLKDLNKATNNTISDFELMRSVLTGLDLGASKEELRTFAEFARLESVRKGTDALQVFNNILGGVLRGSTELLDNFGISLTELNQEIEILAEEKLGKTSTSLSAVERRILSVDAATAIMNRRLRETGQIAETSGERLAQMTKRLDDAKADLGKAIINMSNESADIIDSYLGSIGGIYKILIDLVVDVEVNESQVQKAVDKAKSKTKKFVGKKWQILPDGTKIRVLPGGEELFDALESTFEEIEKRRDELLAKRKTLTPKDFIDIRNIDTEIAELNKYLAPQQNIKNVKPDFVDFAKADKEELDWLDEIVREEEKAHELRMARLGELADNKKLLADWEKKEAEERKRREEEIYNLRMNSISEFGYALEGLSSHGQTMVSYFNAALQAAIRISDAIKSMDTDEFSGMLGVGSGVLGFVGTLLGLKDGGTVINSGGSVSVSPYKKFASGVSNFVVPPGFNKDNYIVGVQSGERLDVTPANQVRGGSSNNDAILKQISNRIGAMNSNLTISLDDLIKVSLNKKLTTMLEGNNIRISYDKSKKIHNRYT